MRRVPWVGVIALLVTSCGESQLAEDRGVVEDVPTWEFVRDSTFRIGSFGSDEGFPLGRVRSVARSSSGDLFVADEMLLEVHQFTETGAHVRSFGGEGDGPGDFDVLSSVWPTPNGVATWDSRHARLTWWTADGAVDSVATFRQHRGQILVGWSHEPRGMVFRQVRGLPSRAEGRGTYVAEFVPLLMTDESDQVIAEVDFFEVVRLAGWPEGRGGLAQRVPFGPIGLGVAAGGVLYVTNGADPVVIGYSLSGRELFRTDLKTDPDPVTEEDRNGWRDREARPFGDDEARARAYLAVVEEEVDFSDYHPAIVAAVAATDGLAWVRLFDRDRSRWIVIGPDGRPVSEVALPRGLGLIDVSAESILAVTTDELDQESIVRYVRVR